MHKSILGILALASVSAFAEVPQWQAAGEGQYLCGGVSEEERAALRSERGEANSELLFTEGPRGGYLADVSVTVRGSALAQPLSFVASGPTCLLKLPKGNYVVEAEYEGMQRTQNMRAGSGRQTRMQWPEAKP